MGKKNGNFHFFIFSSSAFGRACSIYLHGLPACGKSSLSTALQKETSFSLFEADELAFSVDGKKNWQSGLHLATQKALSTLEQGQEVIIDAWYDVELMQPLRTKAAKFISVLVYCPLDLMLWRYANRRNKDTGLDPRSKLP